MHPRDPRLIPAVLLLACLASAAFFGCTETPTETEYRNPLDPDGPYDGDPFNVVAFRSGNSIIVNWTGLTLGGLAGYRVERRAGTEGFIEIAEVEAAATTYEDTSFVTNTINSYRVLAFDEAGNTNATSNITPATIDAPAIVDLGGYTTTPTRVVSITVVAAGADSLQIDDDDGFGSPASFALDAEGTATFEWDLGAADHNGIWKFFHTRVFAGGVAAAVRTDSLQVDFTPTLYFEGNPTTLASRTTPLLISGSGVTRMRFAADRTALDGATWIDPADSFEDWVLPVEPDTSYVFGEFDGEFGFTWVDSAFAAPDSLVGLVLNLNGNEESVIGDLVSVYINAVATEVRAAQSEAALALAPWEPYDGPIAIAHDGCASDLEKTIYAQVRNDWFTITPVSGTVIWQPDLVLGASFAGPDTVSAGAAVTLTGTAVRGTCSDPIDGVDLDTGSGWTTATGTTAWSLAWTAPATAQTDTIRVQVRAGAETSPTQTYIVVVQ